MKLLRHLDPKINVPGSTSRGTVHLCPVFVRRAKKGTGEPCPYIVSVVRCLLSVVLFTFIALNGFAQTGTITVGGNAISIGGTTKFPFWVNGGKNIAVGTNVTEISGVLYNITSDAGGAGGNILTMNSVQEITSTYSIPAGTALKVESVLYSGGCPPASAAVAISGPATICQQGQNSVVYTESTIPNATGYTWAYSGSGATITTSANTASINFAAGATSGNLSVYGTSSCGNGAVSPNYAITVGNAAPTSVSVSGPGAATNFGHNQVVVFTASAVNATSYTWSVTPSTAGTISASGSSCSVTFSGSVGVSATATINVTATECTSTSATLAVQFGGTQTYTTPGAYSLSSLGGVTPITVDMAGAQGGTGHFTSELSNGGFGGRMQAVYPVTPGSTVYIAVGAAGASYTTLGTTVCAGGNGGYLNDEDGGSGNYTLDGIYYGGGGGGGASDIRIGSTALSNRVLVAGGGGGAGADYSTNNYEAGGIGGATTATAGAGWANGTQNCTSCGGCGGGPGTGGNQTTPGAGGCWGCSSSPGSGGNGGASTCSSGGGGGGGGYYGGGAGTWSGGGGGSNYANSTATSVTSSAGYQGSSTFNSPLNGYVTITW